MSAARELLYLDTCDATTLSVSDETKGIFGGYAAVWGEVPFTPGPKGGTFLEPSAFKRTLNARNGKPFPVLWQHDSDKPFARTVDISEDSKGLRFSAKANLNTRLGREAFSDIDEGIITEMSIGFNVIQQKNDNDELHIHEVRLHELSAVTFAANPAAEITESFSANAFAGLPIVDHAVEWNSAEARERVINWADGDHTKAFLIDDQYQIADIVDDQLQVIPRALFEAGAALYAGIPGINDNDQARMKAHVSRYYKQLGESCPWVGGKSISVEHVSALIEQALQRRSDPSPEDTHAPQRQSDPSLDTRKSVPQLAFRASVELERLKRRTQETKARLSNNGQRNRSHADHRV